MPNTPTTPTINVAALQAIADAAAGPGAVTVRVSSRVQIVEQLDKKGRNRAAKWAQCPACRGAREIKAADGLWDDCETCGGEGAVVVSVPTETIESVQVIRGRVTHEMPTSAPQAAIDAFVQNAAKVNRG